jgi:Lrp/AsnC family transcriptional regulator, leucine-responsive regulatory protein
MKTKPLDTLDKAILSALVADGRQSQVQLAERIPLSPTAIARRIKGLEEQGVIAGYQARISRAALGLEMFVIVQVSLKSQDAALLTAFDKAAAASPSIVGCYLMAGEDDYILMVLAKSLSDFERIHKEELSKLPGVTQLKSNFALREVSARMLPVSSLAP